MKPKILTLSAALLFLAGSAIAARHTIENQSLTVSYDEKSGAFSVAEQATGSAF